MIGKRNSVRFVTGILMGLGGGLVPFSASAQEALERCEDVTFRSVDAKEELKTSDCADKDLKVAEINTVLICTSARKKPKSGSFHGFTLSKIPKHKTLDGSVVDLKGGAMVTVNFGSEQRQLVLEKMEWKPEGKRVSFQGKVVEDLILSEQEQRPSDTKKGDVFSFIVLLKEEGKSVWPARLNLQGKSTLRCHTGSWDESAL
jgi:hypothetical protein